MTGFPAVFKRKGILKREFNTEYPSGYIYRLHFVHPVTGNPSTEARRNATLKLAPNKYRPPNK